MEDKKYELIICIVNSGYSEQVMEAAKEAGAGGGTVISGRGTADKKAEELFRITIQPEKDAVLLLVPTNIAADVLHALYKKVGLDTPGQGIAFSLPVDRAVGLGKSVNAQASQKQ